MPFLIAVALLFYRVAMDKHNKYKEISQRMTVYSVLNYMNLSGHTV